MKSRLQDAIPSLKQSPELQYTIISEIGKGTYGKVYKAINNVNDQLVAVKILKIDNELKESHINEILLLQSLNHINILKIHDVYISSDERQIWIVIEYCQYGSLSEIIQMTTLVFSENEIACIVYQVLQGLNYCHTLDIMHRDLRTANILINSQGEIKISDFGLALKEKQSEERIVGCTYFMSPEQLHERAYTKSIDIWSLGICIIELSEGQIPYYNLSQLQVIEALKTKPPSGFMEPQQFSPEMNNFISNFLQSNPLDRPQSCELLKDKFFDHHKQYMSYIKKNICEIRRVPIEKFKKSQIYKQSQVLQQQQQQYNPQQYTSYQGSSFDECSKVKSFNELNFLYNSQSYDNNESVQHQKKQTQKRKPKNKKFSNSCNDQQIQKIIDAHMSRISDPLNNRSTQDQDKLRQSIDNPISNTNPMLTTMTKQIFHTNQSSKNLSLNQNEFCPNLINNSSFLQNNLTMQQNSIRNSTKKNKTSFKLQISKIQQNIDDRFSLGSIKLDSNRTQGTMCSVIMSEQPRNTIKNERFVVKHNLSDGNLGQNFQYNQRNQNTNIQQNQPQKFGGQYFNEGNAKVQHKYNPTATDKHYLNSPIPEFSIEFSESKHPSIQYSSPEYKDLFIKKTNKSQIQKKKEGMLDRLDKKFIHQNFTTFTDRPVQYNYFVNSFSTYGELESPCNLNTDSDQRNSIYKWKYSNSHKNSTISRKNSQNSQVFSGKKNRIFEDFTSAQQKLLKNSSLFSNINLVFSQPNTSRLTENTYSNLITKNYDHYPLVTERLDTVQRKKLFEDLHI